MEEEFKIVKKRLNFHTKVDNIDLYQDEPINPIKKSTATTAINNTENASFGRCLVLKDILKRQQAIAKHSKNGHKIDKTVLEKAGDFKKLMDFLFTMSAENDGSFSLMVDEDDGNYADLFSTTMEPLKVSVIRVKNFNIKKDYIKDKKR